MHISECVTSAEDTVLLRMNRFGVVSVVSGEGEWTAELSGDGEMVPRHCFYPGIEEDRRIKEAP